MFDWFPILRGYYFTAEQYLLLIELTGQLIIYFIYRKLGMHNLKNIQLNVLITTFAHFHLFGIFPLLTIITLNLKKPFILALSLIYYFITFDVCFAMHNQNQNQGFLINLFEAQFSTQLSRYFVQNNKNHKYITLTENRDQIYLTIHSDIDNPIVKIECNNIVYNFTTEYGQDRYLYRSLISITQNNYIQIYYENQKHEFYQYHDFNDNQLIIVNGGDVGNTIESQKIWDQLKQLKQIDLLNIGGDIVYDNGMPSCYLCWDGFFDQYDELCKQQGKLIPLIFAVGNHDVGRVTNSKLVYDDQKGDKLPLFFKYFKQHTQMNERQTYFIHQIGNIQFVTLDSGYLADYEQQAQFLEQNFKQDQLTIFNYHVPILPVYQEEYSFYNNFYNYLNKGIVIFEHHKHNRKRSKKLQLVVENGKFIFQEGNSTYLGNGAMGIRSSKIPNHRALMSVGNECHFWVLKISRNEILGYSVSSDGNILDRVEL